jgi:hypothetical protein
LIPSLIFLALAVAFSGLALTGKPIALPTWAVVEAESRLNKMLSDATGVDSGTALSLGRAVVSVDDDWVPRLRLEDLRLLQRDGTTLLELPEVRLELDPSGLRVGEVRLRSLRLIGPTLGLRRLADGRFDLDLGKGRAPLAFQGIAGVIDAAVAAFSHNALAHLQTVEAEGLSLTFDDALAGRVWQMGDGRFRLENRADELAIEMGVSLVGGGAAESQAGLRLFASKSTSEARLSVTVDQIAAVDIAVQAAPLAFLRVLDAPISGQFESTLDAEGAIADMSATLSFGTGALRPTATTKPVEFDKASVSFRFDPKTLMIWSWKATFCASLGLAMLIYRG